MAAAEEIFEVVDEKGRAVGRAPRSRCHRDPSLIHRAVHVFVLDPDGRVYLQKRGPHKDIQPGRWDTSVGGHVAPGESCEEGAAREMREELGLVGKPRFLYRYLWRTERETELVETFLLETDSLPRPDPSEIDEGRFFTAHEIGELLRGDEVTPNLREELRRLQGTGALRR